MCVYVCVQGICTQGDLAWIYSIVVSRLASSRLSLPFLLYIHVSPSLSSLAYIPDNKDPPLGLLAATTTYSAQWYIIYVCSRRGTPTNYPAVILPNPCLLLRSDAAAAALSIIIKAPCARARARMCTNYVCIRGC